MNHPTSQIKLQIVHAVAGGMSITQVSETFGYHRNSITRWIKAVKKDPKLEAPRKSGSGRPAYFSGETGNQLLEVLSEPASKFGFETDFWTISRILQVCNDKLGVNPSRMAIHRALTRFEYSYRKPETRYYEACSEKQGEWVQNVLPRIKSIIEEKRAVLYFEDESSIQLTPEVARTWAPQAKTAIQKVTGARGSVAAISALSSSGELLFNIHASGKRFSAIDIIGFLKQLLNHHQQRHVVVIMDQARCHTAKKVQNFVLAQKRLNVFYLPPRSPEFNPAEKVWRHLKHNELKSHKATSVQDLQNLASRKMEKMAQNPQKMAAVFNRCEKAHLYN